MAIQDEKLTPAMRQFHQFKRKYPDCILFFRMGDFYETFYEDAEICSRVCGLALTSRSKGDNPISLAGVPYHAVEGYLKKMLQAGYKVAVCEQVEDPKTAKGLVKRDIVRIVTPGTLTDDILLNAKEDNFLCAVSLGTNAIAALVFLIVAASFGFSWLAATDKFDIGWWLGPCGLKQRYGLPCPTCGMTTSVLAFSQGKIFEAFYIQPAAGLLCCVLVVIAFLALFTAVFGVYFGFIKRFFANVKIRYIILALIIIIAAWAVTLVRALAVGN